MKIVFPFFLFVRNSLGVIHKPYETYRSLAKGKQILQALPIFLISLSYFFFAVLIQKGVRTHPFFLTLSFGKITFFSLVTFLFVLSLLYLLSKLFKGNGSLNNLFLPWSYSLWPTIVWFLITSIFYVLIPPPRTPSFLGQLFSLLFLAFSFFLFFWKLVLYYLTLRFGMKLDFLKIVGLSLFLFPILFFYSILTYKMGIFRIPFI